MSRWEVTSEPASEPVTTAEIKSFLRVDHSDDDTLLDSLVKTARKSIEKATGRAFFTQTRKLYLQDFPSGDYIQLPGSPVASVTSLTYIDQDGSQQTFSSSFYTLRFGEPAFIQLNFDQEWEDHRSRQDDVEIIYVCGVADVADIAEDVKTAIKFAVKVQYDESDRLTIERDRRTYHALVDSLKIGEEFAHYG